MKLSEISFTLQKLYVYIGISNAINDFQNNKDLVVIIWIKKSGIKKKKKFRRECE